MSEPIRALYDVEGIRRIETAALANHSAPQWMEQAGQAVFDVLRQAYETTVKVVVLCGPGHNGGDGYVVAHLAHQAGFEVDIITTANHHSSELVKEMHQKCIQLGIRVERASADTVFDGYDVVVDALFGIGLNQPIEGLMADLITKVNDSAAEVIAIDVPSGLHADLGVPFPIAVVATKTVTFIAPKVGLAMGGARDHVGEWTFKTLDLAADCYGTVTPVATQMHASDLSLDRMLPSPRLSNSHKAMFGHVAIAGGAPGMLGAVMLAARAALRVGAGQVTIITHAQHAAMVHAAIPEVTVLASDDGQVRLGETSVDTWVVGPGLGDDAWSSTLWQHLSAQIRFDVVDAGALRLLATHPVRSDDWILTPHPGEAAALLGIDTEAVQSARWYHARDLQARYGGVVVLKGCATLVSIPQIYVCPYGHAGMATAGMGDVLTGIIAGLIAQGCHKRSAAYAGVLLHALAGDMLAEQTGQIGLLASDWMTVLPQLINADRV